MGRAAPSQSSQGGGYVLAMHWLSTPRLIRSTSECLATTSVAPRESIGVTYGLRLQPGPASPHCAAPAFRRAGALTLACRTPSADPQLSQSGITIVPGWHSSRKPPDHSTPIAIRPLSTLSAHRRGQPSRPRSRGSPSIDLAEAESQRAQPPRRCHQIALRGSAGSPVTKSIFPKPPASPLPE